MVGLGWGRIRLGEGEPEGRGLFGLKEGRRVCEGRTVEGLLRLGMGPGRGQT